MIDEIIPVVYPLSYFQYNENMKFLKIVIDNIDRANMLL